MILLGACGDDGGSSAVDDLPTIVATTATWADVVENVACGGQAEVVAVIPPGSDPHAYEPSLADRGLLDDASLVVANGMGLEESLADTLEAAEGAGAQVIRVADHVDTIGYADHDRAVGDDGHGGSDDGHDGHDEGQDPHFWLDPVRVSAALPELAAALVLTAGLDADQVESCLRDYQSELADLDSEIVAQVASVPPDRRLLITNHESMGYFADRYGFEIVGTVLPAPSGLAASSPARLEELAEIIEDSGIDVIFTEQQHSVDDAEALAARVGGVAVVTLLTGTLGPSDGDVDTYVGLLRTNSRRITEALQ